MRFKTWKVLRWDSEPAETVWAPLDCTHCGREAMVPVGATPKPIASMGMGFVFDPPDYPPPPSWMPEELECRKCHHVFGSPFTDHETKCPLHGDTDVR